MVVTGVVSERAIHRPTPPFGGVTVDWMTCRVPHGLKNPWLAHRRPRRGLTPRAVRRANCNPVRGDGAQATASLCRGSPGMPTNPR